MSLTFLRYLHIGLTFPLLVLQSTIEQHHTRFLDPPSHSRVGYVLVVHNSLENLAVGQLASSNLFDFGVTEGGFFRLWRN